MGLESVELIMAVEDKFQIVITEQEYIGIRTPNDLTDVVFSKLKHEGETKCKSQHDFYRVRKTIINVLNVKRNEVKPDTKLIKLLSRRNRKQQLQKIVSILTETKKVHLHFEKSKMLKVVINLSGLAIFTYWLIESEYQIAFSIFIVCLSLLILNLLGVCRS